MTKNVLDKFDKIMDKYLTEKDVKIYLHMPSGTQEVEVGTNLDFNMGGSIMSLYAALRAVEGFAKKLARDLPQGYKVEQFADGVAEMVANEIRESLTAEAKNDR